MTTLAIDTICEIERLMAPSLDNEQMNRLQAVLRHCLFDFETSLIEGSATDVDYLELFLNAKKLEGCSRRTLVFYDKTLRKALEDMSLSPTKVKTEDLRAYLADYQSKRSVSKVTVDNVRRVLSSFFSWLEEESYILKSPVRRIKKIRAPKAIREVYSDEQLECLRDGCEELRDLAIIDLLSSTGIRVGELVGLNVQDMDFENRECIVLGKGDKERTVYFDARTKIHLLRYLKERSDEEDALFVSLHAPYRRLQISGVENMLRRLGESLEIKKVHPHKFRRTMATKAIDRGMPIEQVQVLLGHAKIDTTLCYAMVEQRNVKNSHRCYVG